MYIDCVTSMETKEEFLWKHFSKMVYSCQVYNPQGLRIFENNLDSGCACQVKKGIVGCLDIKSYTLQADPQQSIIHPFSYQIPFGIGSLGRAIFVCGL